MEDMNIYQAVFMQKQVKESFVNLLTSSLANVSIESVKFANRNQRELNLTPQSKALISKVKHIIFNLGDFYGAVQMLNSFKRGTKRLRSNYENQDAYHEWTTKDGNDKLSHRKNLEKGHFRWDEGNRYTLNDEELEKIAVIMKVTMGI